MRGYTCRQLLGDTSLSTPQGEKVLGRIFDVGRSDEARMTSRPFCSLALGLMLAIAATAPGHAQSKTDDPVEKRFRDIEKQLRQLREIILQARDTGQPVSVRVTSGPDPALDGLQMRLDDLEQAARTRNDQIDTLTHDLDVAKKDAADAHTEARSLEQRLDRIEGRLKAIDDSETAAAAAAGPAPAGPSPNAGQLPGPPPPPTGDSAEAFQRAKQLLLQGQYAAASGAFQNFVETYGDTPDGPEARYWLGDTLYIRGLYADAATSYIGAIRGWPQTGWAPQAVVKLARTLVAMNNLPAACKTLVELTRRYPAASDQTKAEASNVHAAAQCR